MQTTETGQGGSLRERLRQAEEAEARKALRPMIEEVEEATAGLARTTTNARRALRDTGWKIWAGAIAVGALAAAVIFFGLMLLRPGWSLTEADRTDLYRIANIDRAMSRMTKEEKEEFLGIYREAIQRAPNE